MIAPRNLAYSVTIPVNIALIVWVWIGRALFGSGGWWILIFLVSRELHRTEFAAPPWPPPASG